MKINYRCSLCGFECSSVKRRVKCPDCNKMALVEIKQEKKPEKKKKINPRQAHFTENKFVDDGKAFAADKKYTKIISEIGSVSPRPPKREALYNNCNRCGKKFRAYHQSEFICNKCGGGR